MKKEEIVLLRGYDIDCSGILTNPKGEVLKGSLCGKYKCIKIRLEKGGPPKVVSFHRIQAFKKFGKVMFEKGTQVRHLNGNPTDNSFDNISIGTYSDNRMDVPKDIRMKTALLATSFVRKHDKTKIRKYYNAHGRSYCRTMDKFNISSKGTLWHILNK